MGTAIYPPFERATANRTCAARLEIPRLFGEHRPVYRVSDERSEQRLEIVQCRHHY
jgi:Txe/YoeB family toxin of Txe-Axe toxin-antitoxin module